MDFNLEGVGGGVGRGGLIKVLWVFRYFIIIFIYKIELFG